MRTAVYRLRAPMIALSFMIPMLLSAAEPGEQYLDFEFLPKDPRYASGSGDRCIPWSTTSESYPYSCTFVAPDGSLTDLVEPVRGVFPIRLPLPRGSRITSIVATLSAVDWGTGPGALVATFGAYHYSNDVILGPAQTLPQGAWCESPLSEVVFSAAAPTGGTLPWDPSMCHGLALNWLDNGAHQPRFQYFKARVGYVTPPAVSFDVPFPLSPNRELESRVVVNDCRSRYYSDRQTVNGQIEIAGTLRDAADAVYPNRTVYFRVHDPADTKPYAQGSAVGDNFDKTNPGRLVGENTNRILVTTTDDNGRFAITLATNTLMSGETYQIEGSPDSYIANLPPPPCTTLTNCTRSAVFTTWRRADIEHDVMFQKGAFLARDVTPTSSRVYFYAMRGVSFSAGEPVVLIHSPTGQSGSYSAEEFTVASTGRGYIELDRSPTHSYFTSTTANKPHLGDAIGKPGAQYEADTTLVAPLFAEAFVDYATLPTTIDTFDWVPYMYQPHAGLALEMLLRWSERRAEPNTHFVAGGEEVYGHSNLGLTWHLDKISLLLAKEIETRGTSRWPTFLQEVTVHEVTHQWQSNAEKIGDHCNLLTWPATDGNAYCLMKAELLDGTRAAAEFVDGVVNFHWRAAASGQIPDSEYTRIRTSPGF